MKDISILTAAGVVLALWGCEGENTQTMPNDIIEVAESDEESGWQLHDGWLFDSSGRRVLLRGVNVSNARKRSPYEGGMTDGDLDMMARLGLNHIRLVTSWAAVMPQRREIDEAYLQRLRDEVQRAGERGLLVVVDSHQDIFGEAIRTDAGPVGNGAPIWACPDEIAGQFTEPVSPWFMNYSHPAVAGCFDHLLNTPELQDEFASAWEAVASSVADLPNVIGYDLWNEPYFGTNNIYVWEAELLMPLYERLGEAILGAHSEGILFLEPGNQKNIFGFTSLPPSEFPNVVYAPHLYHPSMEMGEPYSGDLGFFENRLATDRQDAEMLGGIPLYYGEWGTAGGHENDVQFIEAMADLFEREQVSWAVWDWGPSSGGYSLVDPDLNPNARALALARPFPERTAGDDLTFSFDAASDAFEMSYTATMTDAPTVIVVPTTLYPNGVTIDVIGGSASQPSSGRIEITAAQIGRRVEVVIGPL